MALFSGAKYDGPPRGYGNSGARKRYIAIHNTANDATPAGEATYAKRRTDSVSSHFYADPRTVIQSLDTKYDAWHAGSSKGNREAIAFELTGKNSWSADYWRQVIDRVAPVIADVCRVHDIPIRRLTVAEAKAGTVGGILGHDDMRRAWGGTTHTDPGPNFPWDYLVAKVSEAAGKPAPSAPKPAPSKSAGKDWTEEMIVSLATLKRGSKGQLVKNAQALLNAHGRGLPRMAFSARRRTPPYGFFRSPGSWPLMA